MNVFNALVAAFLVGCGIYMVLSRNMVRLLLGLSLVGTAVNLLIFQTGRPASDQPPIIPLGSPSLGESADPLPQALILTAIVIGFALTVVLGALALRLYHAHGTLNTGDVHSAERLGDPFVGDADG